MKELAFSKEMGAVVVDVIVEIKKEQESVKEESLDILQSECKHF